MAEIADLRQSDVERRTMLCCGNVLRLRLAAVACVLLLLGEPGTRLALAVSEASEVHLSGPRGVFVDREGNILVASPGNNSVVLFKNLPDHDFDEADWPFTLIPFGVIESTRGPTLKSPCDVAVDSKGRIVVADTGNDAVKIYPAPYDSRARPQILGGRLLGKFSSPEGVAVDERDNIIVFDTGNGQVKILSSDGELRAAMPSDAVAPKKSSQALLKLPIDGCYLGNGYLAVADRRLPTFSLWRYDPVSPRSQTSQFIGYGPPPEDAFNFYIRDIACDRERGTVAYIGSNFPLRNAAFLYFQTVIPDDPRKLIDKDSSTWLRVPLIGWLKDPAGVAFDPEGDLYITDAASQSLQKISRKSLAVVNTPVSVEAQSTLAILKYFSPATAPTLLQYGVMPGHIGPTASLDVPGQYEDPIDVLGHTVRLTDLLPSTRYAYRYLLARDFFCRVSGKPVRNFSTTMCFATQPAPGTIEYLDFPLVVLLLTNVLDAPAGAADPGPLTDEQTESIRSQVEAQLESTRLFFWVNSRMTCNIKPEIIPIGERLQVPLLPPFRKGQGEIPRLDDFLSGIERLKNLAGKESGRDLSSTRNLFIISAVRTYDPRVGRYVIKNSPGWTCGLPYIGGAASIFTHSADNAWSFITEYRKHLSIMHLASGREDTLPSLLRDPSADLSMVTWDSPADLLRAMGRQAWLSIAYGIFKVTGDQDEDGIPDDEPNCPLDEKRFGTRRGENDTDGDGVSDLNEILASRWASGFPIISVGEDRTTDGTRAMERCFTPSPLAVDSDGDGVIDSEDRNPLCPLGDLIGKLSVTLDGIVSTGEWENASSMRIVDSEYRGELKVGWSETHLYFSLLGDAQEEPPSIRIRIDGSADGFLRGSDNLSLVFEPEDNRSFRVRQEADGSGFLPGTGSGSPPGLGLPPVGAAWSITGGKHQIEIGLPKSPGIGLNLFAGEEIGMDFELRPAKSAFWLRVFEPLSFFRGLLVRPRTKFEMLD